MACSSVMAKSERSEAKGAVRIQLSQSGPVRSMVDCVSDSHALQILTARLRFRFQGSNDREAELVRKKIKPSDVGGLLQGVLRSSPTLPPLGRGEHSAQVSA